jgi:hypothetical protein
VAGLQDIEFAKIRQRAGQIEFEKWETVSRLKPAIRSLPSHWSLPVNDLPAHPITHRPQACAVLMAQDAQP